MTETKKPGMFSRLFGSVPAREIPPGPNEVPGPPPEGPIPPVGPDDPAPTREDPEPPSPSEVPPMVPEPVIAPPTADAGSGGGGGSRSGEAATENRVGGGDTPPTPASASLDRPSPSQGGGGQAPKTSWWDRLTSGLRRTSTQLSEGVTSIFTKRKLDAGTLEELEDLLIQADLGLDTAARITNNLRSGRYDKEIGADGVRRVLAQEVEAVLAPVAKPLIIDASLKPHVVLVVGVNGTGKTTTIGKLASIYQKEGKRVVLAAGDTFRAAAIEQLQVWGRRTSATVIAKEAGADAAGLAFEAMQAARAEAADVLVIDTAGRLQNKAGLMAELEKILRVIRKQDPTAPHSVLLTLDATTGQNAISQVEIFGKVAGVTGLVMTKLDGTARGGILVAVAAKFGLPVHFIGVGEGIDDLEPFDAREFAQAIAGLDR